MRRVPVPVLAVLLAAAALAGRPGPAAAQQEYPVIPDPSDCQSQQPRPVDEALALWYGPDGSPVAAPPAEGAPAEATIPLGDPADADTVAAVEETVIAVFSCFAAGEFLTATAYFTDDLVAGLGPEFGTSEAEAREFLENPEPEEGGRILAITDMMDLADGRVGAFVVEQTGGDPPLSSYAIFVEGEDGGWLVDEIVEFSTPTFEEGEEGTPAP